VVVVVDVVVVVLLLLLLVLVVVVLVLAVLVGGGSSWKFSRSNLMADNSLSGALQTETISTANNQPASQGKAKKDQPWRKTPAYLHIYIVSTYFFPFWYHDHQSCEFPGWFPICNLEIESGGREIIRCQSRGKKQ
jgi:hypothetical protein